MTRVLLAAALLALAFVAAAAPAQSNARADLKERFRQRHAELERLKRTGTIGETWTGFVAPVGDHDGVAALAEAENQDREALYALLARQLARDLEEPQRAQMTPTVVAQRNAVRNFERASDTERLRVAEGIWVTRKERPWLLRLLELERERRIGERRDGYVAAVGGEASAEIRRIVERENEARRLEHEKEAAVGGRSVASIGRARAEARFESAHIGVLLETPAGEWEAKPSA